MQVLKEISEEQKIIKEIIDDVNVELLSKREYILAKIGKEIGEVDFSFQQFNGRFGGKNNLYVDSVRTQFLDFDDFYAQWLKGLIDKYEEDKSFQLNTYGKIYPVKASFLNLKLIQDKEIEAFVKKFLERNFYNKLNERTRSKPSEKLWTIWFGYQLIYGLIIAPVKRAGQWSNHQSEIRKRHYHYWTIGHILSEGLIDPNLEDPLRFSNINDFLMFYQSVLKRNSVSEYEQVFFKKYVDYLNNSSNIEEEPFLIPEVRYAGLERHHKHRLDFTILNSHTSEYTGFEISPSSSHMSITNLKEKQCKVNIELSKKWDNEMQKRNDYFKEFGITTITFTDSSLANLDKCFEAVIEKLKSRPKSKIGVKAQMDRLNSIK